MKIARSLTELVGNTPILELTNFNRENKLEAFVFGKLEYFNPLSSVKDRIGLSLILEGEAKGRINQDTVIIEPTSGNTGIALAFVCASRGYRLILTMPETMSRERKDLLRALGARLELTPGSEGMKGAVAKAEELAREIENSYIPGQFDNEANPQMHKRTTAQEIWRDMDGKVDIFVAGIGTGGTITGVGEVLREKNPDVRIVAVEPFDSPVLSGGKAGAHKIQGIGAGFVPTVLNTGIYDEIIQVKNEEAIAASRQAAKKEGLLIGVSSGAALHAAKVLALRPENRGRNIVALFPDTGERYLSTGLYEY